MSQTKKPPAAAKPPPKAKSPPPESDKPPRRQKSGGAKRAEKKAGELALIESGFAELLVTPSLLFAVKGDQWAAQHFANRGPVLAKRIAAECERNDTLRRICLQALQGQSVMMLGVELFMYIGLPLMHFGVIPGAEQFGVPVIRRVPVTPPAPPRHAEGGPQAPPPPPAPDPANGGPPPSGIAWQQDLGPESPGDVEMPPIAPA